MARPCHVAGCKAQVLPVLARDGVCLAHFVERVIECADLVRAGCTGAEPADQEVVDWLLGDARATARALSTAETSNEQILELLLCLANLQDYIAHHSVRVKRPT